MELELLRMKDGSFHLCYFDYINGNDRIFKIAADGTSFEVWYDGNNDVVGLEPVELNHALIKVFEKRYGEE